MTARRPQLALVPLVALVAATACGPADREDAGEAAPEAGVESTAEPGVVRVVARDYSFEAPDSIPSGWTTLRFENAGREVHFVILDRLPDGVTFDDFMNEAAPAFDSVWYRLRDGTVGQQEAAEQLGERLPDWFGGLERMGGTGLVAAGGTTRTTLKIPPGDYVMECYVKTPEGEFHVSVGMAHPLTVTRDTTGATPPEADLELTLSGTGIAGGAPATAGRRTVAVHFEEQPPAGLGNDVHLVRLEEGTSLEELASWMNWMNVDGLRAPAPAEFLGGTQEMPAGHTAYFTVDVPAGRYAWIPELPDAAEKAVTFTVE